MSGNSAEWIAPCIDALAGCATRSRFAALPNRELVDDDELEDGICTSVEVYLREDTDERIGVTLRTGNTNCKSPSLGGQLHSRRRPVRPLVRPSQVTPDDLAIPAAAIPSIPANPKCTSVPAALDDPPPLWSDRVASS